MWKFRGKTSFEFLPLLSFFLFSLLSLFSFRPNDPLVLRIIETPLPLKIWVSFFSNSNNPNSSSLGVLHENSKDNHDISSDIPDIPEGWSCFRPYVCSKFFTRRSNRILSKVQSLILSFVVSPVELVFPDR